jgi:hypothetical protein
MVHGGGKTYRRILKPSRPFATGSGRRRYAVSQNHLFAVIARKYVHFGQTALARKGLEETELIAAIRASEQSATEHWTTTSLTTFTFSLRCGSKVYCIIYILLQQNHAFSSCGFAAPLETVPLKVAILRPPCVIGLAGRAALFSLVENSMSRCTAPNPG